MIDRWRNWRSWAAAERYAQERGQTHSEGHGVEQMTALGWNNVVAVVCVVVRVWGTGFCFAAQLHLIRPPAPRPLPIITPLVYSTTTTALHCSLGTTTLSSCDTHQLSILYLHPTHRTSPSAPLPFAPYPYTPGSTFIHTDPSATRPVLTALRHSPTVNVPLVDVCALPPDRSSIYEHSSSPAYCDAGPLQYCTPPVAAYVLSCPCDPTVPHREVAV